MIPKLTSFALPVLLALAALPRACEKKIGEDENGELPQPVQTAPPLPRPAPQISATPVSAFLPDGGEDSLAQARQYEANGQYWLARLLVEPLALGSDGKPEELQLLARICDKQEDDACIASCNERLPRAQQIPIKKRDGGRGFSATPPPPRPDDNTDFARAQRAILANKPKEARAILEPRVLGDKATPGEIRLLREACKTDNDKMCVALCTSKLGGK